MASSLALKRLVASNLLSRSAAARPAAFRLFNTNAIREYDGDDRDLDVERRPERRIFSPFSDILGPFATRSSLNQILNMMDQIVESPSARRNWDARETADGLHLRMDMPGLGKEDIKVSVEQNTLTIRGEGKKEFEDEEDGGRRYSSRIDLPERLYKTSDIKAEMKNGVLKVFVPKIKQEERTDVFHVNVE
ncbi:heat-shock protein [Striga asiatica]|uniref:Heat-shock protein n=1 Tax=Striga asiatica TaxID=4170 RepID=A0A5A7PA24_STRAF|nr:heat-shock protein [Striga asiatica]